KSDLANAKDFFKFNRWVALGFIFAAIQANLGSFMLLRLTDAGQAGIFAAASKLMSFFPQIVGAISITFAPKYSDNVDLSLAKSFFKKTAIISSLAAVGILAILPFADLIIKVFFGEEFLGAVSVLQISTLQTSFLFLSIPATTAILYLWGKSNIYAIIAILQTLVVFGLNALLIPDLGAIGASVSFLVATVLVFVLATAYAVVKLK
ncbi:MAG TPA: polysaccharide biosynthesis C-terminal domain-containing protein, partial [Patescibacteria group bacterium]